MNKFIKTIVVLASVIITPAILFFLTDAIFGSGVVEYKVDLFRGEEFYVFGKRVDSWFATFQILVGGSFIASIPLGVFIGFKLIKRSDNTSTPTNKTKYLIPILTTVIILGAPFFGALGIFLLSGPQATNSPLGPQIQSIKNHLDAGKDVNSKDMFGETFMHKAATSSQTKVVEYLIEKGANVNAKDNWGNTPLLLLASQSGSIPEANKTIELLIGKGADVNSTDNKGMTPLDYSKSFRGSPEASDLLIRHGGKIGAELDISDSKTENYIKVEEPSVSLHEAARYGDIQSAPSPETKPEPPTAKAPDISIHDAVIDGNIAAVKQYIAAGADINAKIGGWTALHHAANVGNKAIVELLTAKGADVNAKDDNLTVWTPLHKAASRGHNAIVEILLSRSANVNAKDGSGRSPLDWAVNWNQAETADLLRKHGGKTGEELKAEGK